MNRLDKVKEKYPNLDWDKLKSFDPSKNSKYLDWLGANAEFADGQSLQGLILEFEKRKDSLTQKDIYKYSAPVLEKELESLGLSRKDKKMIGVVEVNSDLLPNNVKILCLEGMAAVKQYCAGTKWCISDMSTFLNYSLDTNIYVIIMDGKKFCLTAESNSRYIELYNEKDYELELETVESVSSQFSDIIRVCKEHGKSYRNVWKDLNFPVNDPEKFISLLDFSDEKSITKVIKTVSSSTRAGLWNKCIIDYLFKNRNDPKFKTLISSISRMTNTILVKPYSKVYDIKYIGINKYWKKLLSSTNAKPSLPSKEDKIRSNLKKAGGLNFILKNKDIMKILEKELSK